MPTMKDVAREAGVALGTVSKVINDIPVGDTYRIKVEQAIKTLGYEVNTYARGLKTQKTYTVALIVPNTLNPFFATFTYYVELFLSKRGYKMFLCNSNGDRDKELFYINMTKQNKVDGIIVISYANTDDVVSSDMPMVSLDRHFSSSIPCIASDNYGGGVIAAKKLIELGCKNLAFLRIGSEVYGETNKRKDGFVDTCKKENLSPYIIELYDNNDWKNEFANFFIQHISNDICEIDGIFTSSDYLAYQIIKILSALHINVPKDVQIIGYDGVRQFGDLDYCVSSIKQPLPEMAEACVNTLFVKDRTSIKPIVCFPVEFVYGGTTKI